MRRHTSLSSPPSTVSGGITILGTTGGDYKKLWCITISSNDCLQLLRTSATEPRSLWRSPHYFKLKCASGWSIRLLSVISFLGRRILPKLKSKFKLCVVEVETKMKSGSKQTMFLSGIALHTNLSFILYLWLHSYVSAVKWWEGTLDLDQVPRYIRQL
jgi:hypothetical protein